MVSKMKPEFKSKPYYQRLLIAASAFSIYNSTTDQILKDQMVSDLVNQETEALIYTL
jgi:hypothetical protein